jgi:hypothetical protein
VKEESLSQAYWDEHMKSNYDMIMGVFDKWEQGTAGVEHLREVAQAVSAIWKHSRVTYTWVIKQCGVLDQRNDQFLTRQMWQRITKRWRTFREKTHWHMKHTIMEQVATRKQILRVAGNVRKLYISFAELRVTYIKEAELDAEWAWGTKAHMNKWLEGRKHLAVEEWLAQMDKWAEGTDEPTIAKLRECQTINWHLRVYLKQMKKDAGIVMVKKGVTKAKVVRIEKSEVVVTQVRTVEHQIEVVEKEEKVIETTVESSYQTN